MNFAPLSQGCFADLSARLIPLERKIAWISDLMEAQQTSSCQEYAELRSESNQARVAEMAYQKMLRETLQDQDLLRAEAEQVIFAASQSNQALIDDLRRKNQLLQNNLNQECQLVFQERESASHCQQEVAHINLAYNEDVTSLRQDLHHRNESVALLYRSNEVISNNLKAQEDMNMQAQRCFRQQTIELKDTIEDLKQQLYMLNLNKPVSPLLTESSTETEPWNQTHHQVPAPCQSEASTETEPWNETPRRPFVSYSSEASVQTESWNKTFSIGTETDCKVLDDLFSHTDTPQVHVASRFQFSGLKLNFW
jgi:hypothetical protein